MSRAAKSGQMELFADDAKIANLLPKAASSSEFRCTRCLETFLSDHQVAMRFGVTRAAIWRWVAGNPEFPKPIKLSPGTTRWKLSNLVSFEAQKERDATAQLKTKAAGVPT